MAVFFGLIVACWASFNFGPPIALVLQRPVQDGFLIAFLAGFAAVWALFAVVRIGFQGGIWSSAFLRRIVGLLAGGAVFALSVWIAFEVVEVGVRLVPWETVYYRHFPKERLNLAHTMIASVLLGIVLSLARWLSPILKVQLGRRTRFIRGLLKSTRSGMGGSSRFAGLLDEWANPWRPGMILLGSSLYNPRWKVGVYDDRHTITIATSRAGKGRSGIIPNLLTWPGSAVVIDPKGQNAAVTASKRGNGSERVTAGLLRQQVRIVDPFQELKGAGLAHETHRFNPLAELNIGDLDIVEQVEALTDALVVQDPRGESFWDNSAKILIAGAIAHAISAPDLAPEQRTLGTVRDWIARPEGPPMQAMAANRAVGGLAAAAVAQLQQAAEQTAGSIISTAIMHTKWLDSEAMRRVLAVSDFSLKELKGSRPCTVYLVLPPQYLDVHGRFLRLFVSLSIRAVGQGAKPRHAVLFLLDEFYALGRMQLLAKAAGLLAGYGVKLWPIVQNISQMQELYPENWETFMGSAGQWQAFAMNDQTTAQYLSERLGQHVQWRKVKVSDKEWEWVPQNATFMRTSIELARESSRDSGQCLVFVEGSDAFLLRRTPYDRAFRYEEYDADPFEKPRRPPLRVLPRLLRIKLARLVLGRPAPLSLAQPGQADPVRLDTAEKVWLASQPPPVIMPPPQPPLPVAPPPAPIAVPKPDNPPPPRIVEPAAPAIVRQPTPLEAAEQAWKALTRPPPTAAPEPSPVPPPGPDKPSPKRRGRPPGARKSGPRPEPSRTP